MKVQELMLEVGEQNCQEFLQRDLVALNFFSDLKMNCLMCLPVIESLAEEFFGKMFFGKVNIEEQEELKQKYKINKVPVMLVFKEGVLVERIDCSLPEEILREKINFFIM